MKLLLIIAISLSTSLILSQENCYNGIDDDGDGLIDLNDIQECLCNQQILSLIPNPSFEDRNCCPSSPTQMNCANNWQQATQGATSDYFNQCNFNKMLTTNDPSPYPNGNACAGFYDSKFLSSGLYKEYIGSCLSGSMQAGVSYTLKMNIFTAHEDDGLFSCNSNDLDLTLYGTQNCSSFPINGGIMNTNCPTIQSTMWFEITSMNVSYIADSWQEVTFQFTPTTSISAIIIGPGCSSVSSPLCVLDPASSETIYSNYYYLDNLRLLETTQFNELDIVQSGNYCQSNVILSAELTYPITNPSYQWFKNGIAILGATNSIYNAPPGLVSIGDYQVKVWNGTFCKVSQKHILLKNELEIELSSHSPSCYGKTDGEIFVQVQGSSAPVTYFVNQAETQYPINQVGAGIFEIVVKDTNLCEGKKKIEISQPDSLIINLNNKLCLTPGQHWISYKASGGTPGYQYLWNGLIQQDSLLINALEGTSFEVEAIDINQCHSEKHKVTISTLPIVDFEGDTLQSCPPLVTKFSMTIKGVAIENISSVVWYFGDGSKAQGMYPNEHSYHLPGLYSVGLRVSTENGCVAKNSKNNYIQVFDIPVADFLPQIPENAVLNPDVYFKNETTHGETFAWSFLGKIFSTQQDARYTFDASQGGEFEVCLKAISIGGCIDSTCQKIKIKDQLFMYIPNTFTPDGDALNDVFNIVVTGEQIEYFECSIFNRWGEMITRFTSPDHVWDGRLNQTPCPQDIYVWKVGVKYVGQKYTEKTGTVLLLR